MSNTIIFSLLIFLTIFSISLASSDILECDANDHKALIAIYNHFGKPSSLSSWLSPKVSCCGLTAVECYSGFNGDIQDTNRVKQLLLIKYNLSGTIPPEIGNLPFLENLVINQNPNLIGTIPSSITNLKKLVRISFDQNSLSGPIPDYWSQMTSLELIDLSFNKFSGLIPPSITKLDKLADIRLQHNELSGPVPEFIGSSQLLQLMLSFNKLSGSIPPSYTKLKNLTSLHLDHNQLTGPIHSFTGLNELDLSFNKLSGSIPPSITKLNNIWRLYLNNNRLTGRIPELAGFDFGQIYLHNNRLSGPIPRSLGGLAWDILDLSNNKLTGDASFLFGSRTFGSGIHLQLNKLSFNFTNVTFTTNLRELQINNNNIYGSIPEQINELFLIRFNVSYNLLCGEIPQGRVTGNFGIRSYFHNKCLCGFPLRPCK